MSDLLDNYPAKFFQSTKRFTNYPCAHRQWRHDGDCKLIHGYSRSFLYIFGGYALDKCGFLVDFGQLDWLKAYHEAMFDHTFLLNKDDPEFDLFLGLAQRGVLKLVTYPQGIGMEGTAEHLCGYADGELRQRTKGRCWVISVEAFENDKNSAIYLNPAAGFKGWHNE